MDTTTPARHDFVAHYTRHVDGILTASCARRLHAPHEDAAIALATRNAPRGFGFYSLRGVTDRDSQPWL